MRRTRTGSPAQRHLKSEHYADLFDFAPVTYALLDPAGIIRKANLAAARLLNVGRRHLLGRPLMNFVIKPDRSELLDHFRTSRLSRQVVESEIRFAGNGGGTVRCRVYTKRVSYEGHPAYPTVIVDQTERLQLDEALMHAEREKEAAERASELARAGNAAKDRFLATVSHELRTPLTPALLAASQLSSWEGIPEEARTLALKIKRNIQFEARLIDDLLDVARINRDRLQLDLETADAHELVREAVEICRPAMEGRQQQLTLSLFAELPFVKADKSRLRQVFWNLLNNAIKFTPPGGEIIIRSVNVPENMLRVIVHDNGTGMDSSVLQSLFAPFDRHLIEHDSRGGLGLGLSICKGIITAHDGQIWATSDGAGRGSTFGVELSIARDTQNEQEARPAEEATARRPGTPRVLVIEDDRDSRDMMLTLLVRYGYEARAAATFDEAIERLAEPWDLILTDLSLPGGSGLDIGRRARQLERPPSRIIALSGYGSADDRRRSREAGFDDHLVKPLDLDTLLKTIGQPGTGRARPKPAMAQPRARTRGKRR